MNGCIVLLESSPKGDNNSSTFVSFTLYLRLCGERVGSIHRRSASCINGINKFKENSPWKSIHRYQIDVVQKRLAADSYPWRAHCINRNVDIFITLRTFLRLLHVTRIYDLKYNANQPTYTSTFRVATLSKTGTWTMALLAYVVKIYSVHKIDIYNSKPPTSAHSSYMKGLGRTQQPRTTT